MKFRIVLIFVLILNCFALGAQSYNAVRIAGGVVIAPNPRYEPEYVLKVGPSISIAYARGFNQYISAEAEVYSGFVNNNDITQSVFFDIDAKFMVTPLAKFFKYLELGVGLALRYERYTMPYGERHPETDLIINCSGVYDSRGITMGINYCVRLYAIRNARFDLFAFYEPRTNFTMDFSQYYWATSNAGVAFGVKF